jgi:hypothetical protein
VAPVSLGIESGGGAVFARFQAPDSPRQQPLKPARGTEGGCEAAYAGPDRRPTRRASLTNPDTALTRAPTQPGPLGPRRPFSRNDLVSPT